MKNLTGSEKQINWADDIRNNIMSQLDALVSKTQPGMEEQVKAIYDDIASHTEASWWIDIKDMHISTIIRMAANRVGMESKTIK